MNPRGYGYDILFTVAVSKILLTVGAVEDIEEYTGLKSVVQAEFSSWGPTDDWRIKPDLVANGIEDINSYLKKVKPAAFEIILRESDELLAQSEHIRKHDARVGVNTLWDSLCAGYSDPKAVTEPDANWGHLIGKGVNIIQTDNPAELIQYLNDQGLRDF